MDGNTSSRPGDPAVGIGLAQLLGALSHALDITEGQPEGHCVRCCWIGMQLGCELGLGKRELRDLYYTLLLKDLGCSSNAARISQLYRTDDLRFKRDFKLVGDGLPQVLGFVLDHTGMRDGLSQRFRSIVNIFQNGGEIARELIETRCHRGAQIALQLRFSRAVADGIQNLDEHWDGGGKPLGLMQAAIPLASRIALLAQVADVFCTSHGPQMACREIQARIGTWFDPALAQCFARVAAREGFWQTLASPQLSGIVFELEPARDSLPLDDDYLDDIAVAFGQIADAKSPYTSGHSERVALYADMIAEFLGLPPARRRWLRRASLLHDLGKLGVSSSILDKPGPLDEAQWVAMRRHAALTQAILSRIDVFAELARVASSHHERLDGRGYPLGLDATQICLETRIITTADVFDAITAERPYRKAAPIARALEMMSEALGSAIDPRCLQALKAAVHETQQPAFLAIPLAEQPETAAA